MLHKAFAARSAALALARIGVAAAIGYAGWRAVRWALVDAIWWLPPGAASDVCRAQHGGACWAVIADRYRFILFGTYPPGQHWRPAVVCALFLALYGVSAFKSVRPLTLLAAVAIQVVAPALMRGGFAGLTAVPPEFWGGLPLTFMISAAGFTLSFPAAILLALGRRSAMPAMRVVCTAYVQLARAVPLVMLLFMASVVLPLMVPRALVFDTVVRAVLTFAVVMAAYEAEVVGAGLDGIAAGQHEAAAALGLPYWPATLQISLPQALQSTLPATVNTFVAFFKDTALVAVIGLFDLLGAAHAVLADQRWAGFGVEVYSFVALIYGLLSYAASGWGRRLERTIAGGVA